MLLDPGAAIEYMKDLKGANQDITEFMKCATEHLTELLVLKRQRLRETGPTKEPADESKDGGGPAGQVPMDTGFALYAEHSPADGTKDEPDALDHNECSSTVTDFNAAVKKWATNAAKEGRSSLDLSPLKFWLNEFACRLNRVTFAEKFPELFSMATHLLSIPSTSIGIESVFSHAGIIADSRSRHITENLLDAQLRLRVGKYFLSKDSDGGVLVDNGALGL